MKLSKFIYHFVAFLSISAIRPKLKKRPPATNSTTSYSSYENTDTVRIPSAKADSTITPRPTNTLSDKPVSSNNLNPNMSTDNSGFMATGIIIGIFLIMFGVIILFKLFKRRDKEKMRYVIKNMVVSQRPSGNTSLLRVKSKSSLDSIYSKKSIYSENFITSSGI
jgi:hypothetical protein